MYLGESGGTRATALIYILVAVVVIYAAVKTVPAYMDYYAMEDEVRRQVHLSSINPDAVILSDIEKKAAELEIPLKQENTIIGRSEDGVFFINLKWTVDVDYGYGFRRFYNFDISANAKEEEKT